MVLLLSELPFKVEVDLLSVMDDLIWGVMVSFAIPSSSRTLSGVWSPAAGNFDGGVEAPPTGLRELPYDTDPVMDPTSPDATVARLIIAPGYPEVVVTDAG